MKMPVNVKRWWDGEYIPEPPSSPLLFGYYKRHWTSELAHAVVAFYMAHWKWFWPVFISIAGLIAALMKL